MIDPKTVLVFFKKKYLTQQEAKVVYIYFGTRAFLVLIAAFSAHFIDNPNAPYKSDSLLDIFFQWDSGWYLKIAKEGYICDLSTESSCAFFPLFPLLIRMFYFLIPDYKISGYIISNFSSLLASIYLFKLVKIDYSTRIAYTATICSVLNPMGFFSSIIYTEGLYGFLSILFFYQLRKRKWTSVNITGVLLTATRATGIFLLIPLFIEKFYYKGSWDISRRSLLDITNMSFIIIPAGIIGFMIFQLIEFHDFFAFVTTSAAWGRKLAPPWVLLLEIKNYPFFYQFLFSGSILVSILLIATGIIRKCQLSYVFYTVFYLLFILSTNHPSSIPRYISAAFPLYIFAGVFLSNKPILFIVCLVISTMLLSLYTILFVNGFWIV